MFDGVKMIINREDESICVDENTLLKSDSYKTILEYAFNNPVISVITTHVPKNECVKILKKSPTQSLEPIIISFDSIDGEKILNTLTVKIQ